MTTRPHLPPDNDAYLAAARTQNPNARHEALHSCLPVNFQTRISGFTPSALEERRPGRPGEVEPVTLNFGAGRKARREAGHPR